MNINMKVKAEDCEKCVENGEPCCEEHCKELFGHDWDSRHQACRTCGVNWAEYNADNYQEPEDR